MANYNSLKTTINGVVRTNGNEEITGANLNQVLTEMVNVLGTGYQYMGAASASTDPGTPDARVFYLATEAGTYTNFGLAVTQPSILYYDTQWHLQTLDGDFSATLRVADIINALNSTATDKPLAAAQGKVLYDILMAGYQFIGVATPSTTDSVAGNVKCFWLAATKGDYTNLGSVSLADNEIAVITRNAPGGGLPTYTKTSLGTYVKPSDLDDYAKKADLDDYAKKDGYYETLGAGTADNLRGDSVTSAPLLCRMTGGEAEEVANGIAALQGIEGHSVAWKQIIKNGNFGNNTTNWTLGSNVSASVSNNVCTLTKPGSTSNVVGGIIQNLGYTNGHKYLFMFDALSNNEYTEIYMQPTDTSSQGQSARIYCSAWTSISYLWTRTGTSDSFRIYGRNTTTTSAGVDFSLKNVMCFDLTLIFGVGNEPATAAAFEEWLATNIGVRAYYDYNVNGAILNAKPKELYSTGRNLLNPETGEAILKSYEWPGSEDTYEIIGSYTALSFTDVLGNTTTPVPDANGKFVIDNDGVLTVTAADLSLVCVQAVWDESYKGEYIEFLEDEVDIDVTTWTGVNRVTGDRETIFPNGMKSAGSVRDAFKIDNQGNIVAVKNVGSVDLGTKSWEMPTGTTNLFKCSISDKVQVSGAGDSNLVCSKYAVSPRLSNIEADAAYNVICEINSQAAGNSILLADSGHDTAPTSGSNWLDGVMLNYELATPVIYTDIQDAGGNAVILPMNYTVDNWGIERVESDSTEGAAEPQTVAPVVNVIYAMDAVEEIDTLKTNGVMTTDFHDNMSAFLAKLNEALADIGTISISATPATDSKVFTFTFTPATTPE